MMPRLLMGEYDILIVDQIGKDISGAGMDPHIIGSYATPIIVLTPVLLPVVVKLGMDPITFGVVIVANLAIGFVTPPYGPNLFVAAAVARIKMETMLPYVKWMILAMVVALLMITYIEPITMMFI
ncbi:MAG: TRAP transporter large permease subunit [Clostridiales bacterium]